MLAARAREVRALVDMLKVVRVLLGLVERLEADDVAVGADIAVRGGGRGRAGELEEVDAEEGRDEAGEEGEGVCGVVGVEALEEDDGGDDRGCGEADVVHRVHAVHGRRGRGSELVRTCAWDATGVGEWGQERIRGEKEK